MPSNDFWLWLMGAYILGATPFGFMIGKARGVDLRQHGSGNIGATNAGRILGRKWGLICFALDVLKGFGPTLCVSLLADKGQGWLSDAAQVQPTRASLLWLCIGMMTIVGHCFPFWLKFKGGKGVATSLGMLLGLFPVLTLPAGIAFLIWFGCVQLTGYVGLASVLAAAVLPPLAAASSFYFKQSIPVFTGLCALLAALVIWRHRSNLRNLKNGTEAKVLWSWRGKQEAATASSSDPISDS